ncbi:hypothetical protein FSP39_021690 [Pinctada imbricata]|uniref:G-protein coupled receptors family 1 profile domain-containing protein n=1 Tax=Pinctada imbricata TaxID=66713 RepID=A0AA88YKI9_PINIB|nr:hypothetical protein FSP39_021690 [Pinctada imbricata]
MSMLPDSLQRNASFGAQSFLSPTGNDSTSSIFLPLYLKVPLGTFLIAIIAASVIGNAIVCFIVYPKPAMRSSINLLLANMALSDVGITCFCMPFSFVTLVTDEWTIGSPLCRLLLFFQECFICAGSWTILIISIDRYCIIVWRKDRLTSYRAKKLIGCIWIGALLLSFPPLVGFGDFKFSPGYTQCYIGNDWSTSQFGFLLLKMSTTYFLPILAMTFAYICILIRVQKNKMKVFIQRQNDFAVAYYNEKLGLPVISFPRRDHPLKQRSFRTVLKLYVIFSVCWLPFAIYAVIRDEKQNGQHVIYTLMLWIGFLKAMVNPISYFIWIQKFRTACRDFMPRMPNVMSYLPTSARRRINPQSVYEC